MIVAKTRFIPIKSSQRHHKALAIREEIYLEVNLSIPLPSSSQDTAIKKIKFEFGFRLKQKPKRLDKGAKKKEVFR